MYTVSTENNEFEPWMIDLIGVAKFGADRDAQEFGVVVTVTDESGELLYTAGGA